MTIDLSGSVCAAGGEFGRGELQEWWKRVLAEHGRYRLYGLFLALPLDYEARRYAKDYAYDLHLASGEDCLILGLGKWEFKRFGVDTFARAVESKVGQNYAMNAAAALHVDLTEIPCLILFEDLKNADHIVITLKELTAEEIGSRIREVFSLVRKAIEEDQSPLSVLERQRHLRQFQKAGSSVVSTVRSIAKNTFQSVVQAWLETFVR